MPRWSALTNAPARSAASASPMPQAAKIAVTARVNSPGATRRSYSLSGYSAIAHPNSRGSASPFRRILDLPVQPHDLIEMVLHRGLRLGRVMRRDRPVDPRMRGVSDLGSVGGPAGSFALLRQPLHD